MRTLKNAQHNQTTAFATLIIPDIYIIPMQSLNHHFPITIHHRFMRLSGSSLEQSRTADPYKMNLFFRAKPKAHTLSLCSAV